MTTSEFSIRTATAHDYEETLRVFGDALLVEFKPRQVDRDRFEPDRALIAEIDGEAAGVTKTLTRGMSVPGNTIPVAHVTGVGVGATHRRQGVLSGLMRRQLRELPESLAALWASETAIYGRYGYAAAGAELRLTAQLPRVKVLPGAADTGRLRRLDAASAAKLLPAVLEEYQRGRPGVSARRRVDWAVSLDDPADNRNGASERRITVHEDAEGRIDGYTMWRTTFDFDATGPNGQVHVQEVVANTPDAYRSLWTHLLTMDLCRTLRYLHVAVDEPLWQLVANPRALAPAWADTLWLRVTDVASALRQRRYGAPVDLVLDVTDELIENNNRRFHLTGDRDTARCEPTEAAADVSLTVNELSAIYLGGRSLTEFASLGRVTEHTPGAVFAASAGFGWPTAPGSVEIF